MARSKDPIKAARQIFDEFLSKVDPDSMAGYDPNAKDPAKQAAGLKGGAKGGRRRARKLSAKRRIEIARKAAETRWKKS